MSAVAYLRALNRPSVAREIAHNTGMRVEEIYCELVRAEARGAVRVIVTDVPGCTCVCEWVAYGTEETATL